MSAANSAEHVSTVLYVGITPAASRASRTSDSVLPHKYANCASLKPTRFTRFHAALVIALGLNDFTASRSSMMIDIWSKNQGSTLHAACTSSTETPRNNNSPIIKIRSGVGISTSRINSSVETSANCFSAGSQLRPKRPCSSERKAFCKLSGNVRPMAITSPTLCI